MFKLFVFSFLTLVFFQAKGQTTEYRWYKESGHIYCGEYIKNSEDRIRSVDRNICRGQHPTHLDWYKESGYIYCGEYTPDGDHIQSVDRNNCRNIHPTYFDWYKESGYIYCGEYTPKGDRITSISPDICRKGTRNTSAESAKPATPIITIEELNRLLQPPEDSQVFITAELAIPRNSGCGAPQDTDDNVQCYICQTQSSRNAMLYTAEGILGLGGVQMIDTRQEVRIGLVNSDDLGTIRCLSKNKKPITTINSFEDLIKALNKSGIRFKDPGYIVKKLNERKQQSNSQAAGQNVDYVVPEL